MLGHEPEIETPEERVDTSGTTSSSASTSSASDQIAASETLGDHDPYQRHHPLHDILEEGVTTELHRIATALSRHRSRATAGPDEFEADSALNLSLIHI